MSELEIHAKEDLKEMSRLTLRRICKARGAKSEECSQMKFDDMVDLILDLQEGGEGKAPKKTASKGSPKDDPKEGKKTPPKSRAKKAPPKSGTKKPKDSETDPEDPSSIPVDARILDLIQELGEKIQAMQEKVDTIGEVMDQNLNALTEDLNELRADSYKSLELAVHFYNWLRADQILTDDSAPNGLDFDDKAAEIDEACGGNGNGGE